MLKNLQCHVIFRTSFSSLKIPVMFDIPDSQRDAILSDIVELRNIPVEHPAKILVEKIRDIAEITLAKNESIKNLTNYVFDRFAADSCDMLSIAVFSFLLDALGDRFLYDNGDDNTASCTLVISRCEDLLSDFTTYAEIPMVSNMPVDVVKNIMFGFLGLCSRKSVYAPSSLLTAFSAAARRGKYDSMSDDDFCKKTELARRISDLVADSNVPMTIFKEAADIAARDTVLRNLKSNVNITSKKGD